MSEAVVVKKVMLKASELGSRLFRNNRGMFLTLDGKRKVRAGLEASGASDLIGFVPVEITEDMVGKTVAVFSAIEVKKPSWKKPSGEHEIQQENFIRFIKENGGISGFINNQNNLKIIIDEYKNNL